MVTCQCTPRYLYRIENLRVYWSKGIDQFTHADFFHFMREISFTSAAVQLILLAIVMFTGEPGVFQEGYGFMYISDNFCSKQWIAILFMVATLPTWTVLACSIALETDPYRRNTILGVISLPLPLGLGIVFYSICDTPSLHYVYVNAFVLSLAGVHVVVAATARHFVFIQPYSILLVATALCGMIFMVLAMSTDDPGVQRNSAVIFEYLAMTGFIVLNSLVTDRVREHVNE